MFVNLVYLMLNVPVNNFSVMLGWGHCFLGNTSTFWGVNMSCSRTQHSDPSGGVFVNDFFYCKYSITNTLYTDYFFVGSKTAHIFPMKIVVVVVL